MPILPSVLVEYFRRFTFTQLPNSILVYNLGDTDIVVFLDNVVIVQGGQVALIDSSAPLKLACTNSTKYILMDRTKLQYTAYCGPDASVWTRVCAASTPVTLGFDKFIEWKRQAYPDDERILVEHVLNFVYSMNLLPAAGSAASQRRRLHI